MHRILRVGLLMAALALFSLVGQVCAQEGEGFWRAHTDGAWKACREGDATTAAELLQVSLKVAEKFAPDDPRLGLTLSYAAFIAFKQGKNPEANKYAEKALAIYDAASADKAPEMGKGLNALALLRQGQKKYDEAAGLY